MNNPELLNELVAAVKSGLKYRAISDALIRQVGAQELGKGRKLKDAVKATRNKLHQVGGAYQEQPIDYPRWLAELETLPRDRFHPAVRDFCRRMMALHASTRERLPVLDQFYAQTLDPIGPLKSVLDLACGLNPLALAWMPLAPDSRYFACDIYADMTGFLNRFFTHMGQAGQAWVCDLVAELPNQEAQIALALKTIPCLEQLDKTVGARLLAQLNADTLLISFPAHSLAGRSKGMLHNYESHFRALLAGTSWLVERFEFSTELAFLVKK